MNPNPLVGYTAVAPDGAFLAVEKFSLVVGPSRRAWLQLFLTKTGLGAWRVFPIFADYLEPALETGARGQFALDGEAFQVFDLLCSAKGRQPAGTFILRFDGESEDNTFFIYGHPVGLN